MKYLFQRLKLLLIKKYFNCGLRLSELINLQLTDVKSDSDLLLIQQSKGNKDRLVALPDKLLILLREYYIAYKPKVFLFEGANNTKYSERSVHPNLTFLSVKIRCLCFN